MAASMSFHSIACVVVILGSSLPVGAAGYNPATGTYARSAYAYGPYGSAATTAAYNPYTGARGASTRVHTAYGSAGRGAAYNPTTGTHARAGYKAGPYGSVGFAGAANPRTGTSAGVAAWNTPTHQGAAAKTRSGDLYATNGDTVYRRESGGGWSSNSGEGWQSTPKPRAATSSTPGRTGGYSQSISTQAQARQRGNQLSQRASQFRSRGTGRLSGGGSARFQGLGRRR